MFVVNLQTGLKFRESAKRKFYIIRMVYLAYAETMRKLGEFDDQKDKTSPIVIKVLAVRYACDIVRCICTSHAHRMHYSAWSSAPAKADR